MGQMSSLTPASRARGLTAARRAFVVAAVALVPTLATFGIAHAVHVTPETIAGAANKTCAELAKAGQTWIELKADPNADGTFSDGTLTVVIAGTTNDKTFNWTSNIGVDAVFVKAGSAGSHLYRYDDPTVTTDPGETQADTGLTSPGAGSTNQISHIAFCYDTGASPSPSPSEAPTESPSPSPSVSPTETETGSPSPSTSVLGTQTTSASPSTSVLGVQTTLPSTGGKASTIIAILGLAFVGLGSALAAISTEARRRTAS